MWHPLLIGITALDLLTLSLLADIGLVSINIILKWRPESAGADQLRLERKAEAAEMATQWAFWLLGMNALFFVAAITRVLPQLVPGAMCGMGVMQALEGRGYSIIVLRCLAFAVLYWQRMLAGINRTDPMSPLTVTLARLALLTLLFFAMAAYATAKGMFWELNPTHPVSCCAAVFDQISSQRLHPARMPSLPIYWQSAYAAMTFVIIVGSAIMGRHRKGRGKLIHGHILIGLSGMVWTVAATICLIFFWSPYIYQVLDHPCPFCFFLPEHYGIGFPLFTLLAWVALESWGVLWITRLQKRHPFLEAVVVKRCRLALRVLFWGGLGYTLLAVFPALIWRLRFGVWI